MELRGGRCRFSKSRAGFPARYPSSPFTLTRLPVSSKWCRSRAFLLGSSWGGSDLSGSLRLGRPPRLPVEPVRTGGFSVLYSDFAATTPLPDRSCAIRYKTMMNDLKHLVKIYFATHRVTPKSFQVAPRSSRVIHRPSTGAAMQYTAKSQVRPHLA